MSYRSNLSPREYAVLKARTARMARNAANVVKRSLALIKSKS